MSQMRIRLFRPYPSDRVEPCKALVSIGCMMESLNFCTNYGTTMASQRILLTLAYPCLSCYTLAYWCCACPRLAASARRLDKVDMSREFPDRAGDQFNSPLSAAVSSLSTDKSSRVFLSLTTTNLSSPAAGSFQSEPVHPDASSPTRLVSYSQAHRLHRTVSDRLYRPRSFERLTTDIFRCSRIHPVRNAQCCHVWPSDTTKIRYTQSKRTGLQTRLNSLLPGRFRCDNTTCTME